MNPRSVRAVSQILFQLVRAKDGDLANLMERVETGYRCRFCHALIHGPVRMEHYLTRHFIEAGHNETAEYIRDNDLYVPNKRGQTRLQQLNLGNEILCGVGVVSMCHVLVAPKWVTSLITGWYRDTLIRKVLQRAMVEPDWKDALIAVSNLPDTKAMDVFITHQYPDDMMLRLYQ